MLKQRVITAVVLVAIVLGALFGLARDAFALVAAIFFLAAAWEWSAWIGKATTAGRIGWLAVVAALMWGMEHWQLAHWLTGAPLFWLCALVMVVRGPKGTAAWGSARGRAVVGADVRGAALAAG